MGLKCFLILLVFSSFAYSLDVWKYKYKKKNPSPNIVIIMADDLGWNDVGFHGQNQIPTPNFDALAYNGVVLNRFYTLPSGTASMAALLTGRYPMRMGLQGASILPGEDRALPPKLRILPQWLKQLGYKTSLVGRWGVGHARKIDTPTLKGYDSFFGTWNEFVGHFDYETQSMIQNCSVLMRTGYQDDCPYCGGKPDPEEHEHHHSSHSNYVTVPPVEHSTVSHHPYKPPHHHTEDPDHITIPPIPHETIPHWPPHYTDWPPHHHTDWPPHLTDWPPHHTDWPPHHTDWPPHHHTHETTTTEKPTKPTRPTWKPTHPTDCLLNGFDLHDGLRPAFEYKGQYATTVLTEKATTIIKSHSSKQPLFLFVSQLVPHTGKNNTKLEVADMEANDKEFAYIKDVARRRYAGMVKDFDDSIGAIMKALAHKGLLSNTIVLVLSDNGAKPIGSNANRGSGWPLKGMKGTPYEGGVRGTAVIYSPLLKFKGHILNSLFHITDILPTLVAAAGGEASTSSIMDGIDQWKSIKEGQAPKRTECLINIDETNGYSAIISNSGRFKLVNGTVSNGIYDGYYGDVGRGVGVPPYDLTKVLMSEANLAIKKMNFLSTLLTKDKSYKIRLQLDIFGKCDELKRVGPPLICRDYCLFDLFKDPCETTDVSQNNENVVMALQAKLLDFRKSLVPQKKLHISPFANPNRCNGAWFTWKDWSHECHVVV